jgi:hypothetical protein
MQTIGSVTFNIAMFRVTAVGTSNISLCNTDLLNAGIKYSRGNYELGNVKSVT